MTQDEIIELAVLAEFEMDDSGVLSPQVVWYIYQESLIKFAKLVAAKERERYMQLFLDPENQPTQFGTATQEYREQEIKDERESCADLCATFYDEMWEEYAEAGNELAEIIRARGEQ